MLNKCVWSARFFGLITSNYKQWCLYLVASQKIESVKLQKMFSICIAIKKKRCIGRESNPGRPRGRRAFYHWTTDATPTSIYIQADAAVFAVLNAKISIIAKIIPNLIIIFEIALFRFTKN
jgi:hypothetical protein